MRTGLTVLVLSALLALLLTATPATATQSQVIADCNAHGKLTQTYSAGELRTALSTMPADVKEYTDCYDVVQQALVSQLSGAKGTQAGGSGGGGSSVPTWLIVVLVLLGLSAATLAAVAVRRRGAQP